MKTTVKSVASAISLCCTNINASTVFWNGTGVPPQLCNPSTNNTWPSAADLKASSVSIFGVACSSSYPSNPGTPFAYIYLTGHSNSNCNGFYIIIFSNGSIGHLNPLNWSYVSGWPSGC